MKDYYKILGVERNSSQEDIKKAYRKRSMEVHPDRNFGEQKYEELFKEVQEAYEILGNPRKKSNYDYSINRSNTSSTRKIISPEILTFTTAQQNFFYGKPIIFHWETKHADFVELFPFGQVEPSGSSTFRLKNLRQPYLQVELRASNSKSQRITTKKLILTNETFIKSERWFRRFKRIQSVIILLLTLILVVNLVKNCKQDEFEERERQSVMFEDRKNQ